MKNNVDFAIKQKIKAFNFYISSYGKHKKWRNFLIQVDRKTLNILCINFHKVRSIFQYIYNQSKRRAVKELSLLISLILFFSSFKEKPGKGCYRTGKSCKKLLTPLYPLRTRIPLDEGASALPFLTLSSCGLPPLATGWSSPLNNGVTLWTPTD